MCAFMPASANWIGWVSGGFRASKRGVHAGVTWTCRLGVVVRLEEEVREVHVEAIEELRSQELVVADRVGHESGDLRYIRLKYATPSLAGRAESMGSSLDETVDVLGVREAGRRPGVSWTSSSPPGAGRAA